MSIEYDKFSNISNFELSQVQGCQTYRTLCLWERFFLLFDVILIGHCWLEINFSNPAWEIPIFFSLMASKLFWGTDFRLYCRLEKSAIRVRVSFGLVLEYLLIFNLYLWILEKILNAGPSPSAYYGGQIQSLASQHFVNVSVLWIFF